MFQRHFWLTSARNPIFASIRFFKKMLARASRMLETASK
jgi:hypothetical protein